MNEPRVYGGQTAEQRKRARRERFIATGLDVFGTTGFASSSIERLCSRASVSTRYFYEEFASREALLAAVYDEVLSSVTEVGREAMARPGLAPLDAIETGLRTYVLMVTSDPRRTRVVHQEVRTVLALTERRRVTAARVAEILRDAVGAPPAPDGRAFVPGLVVLGAVSEVLADWTALPEPRPPVGPIAQELCQFARAALGPFVTPDGPA